MLQARSSEEIELIIEKIEPKTSGLDSASRAIIRHFLRNFDTDYCSNCFQSGTHFIFLENRSIITSKCECAIASKACKKIVSNTSESRIPKKYRDASIDGWTNMGSNAQQIELNRRSLLIISKYIDKINDMKEKGYGLFICGPNGVGKTYLTCAIANAILMKGFSVRFYQISEIISTIVEGWYDEEERKKNVSAIRNCDFLIVDDFDKAYKTKTGLEVTLFDNLFRERVQNCRPVIFTSNSVIEQMGESYSASVASMLMEQSAKVVLVGTDYRRSFPETIVNEILKDE